MGSGGAEGRAYVLMQLLCARRTVGLFRVRIPEVIVGFAGSRGKSLVASGGKVAHRVCLHIGKLCQFCSRHSAL